ncbi:MAG: hypothetical protein V3U65_02825 [Granulosicoccaceae bacterium]
MIRTTLSTLLLTASVLLVSCTSGLPDEVANNSNSPSDDAPKLLSNSNDQDSNDSSDDSVAGLWDLSDGVEELYQYWTDNNTFATYDYQGDGDGTGENCYELDEVPYMRKGSEFTYSGGTHTITRDSNTLIVDGVPFPLVISYSVVDLDVCI